MKKLTIILLFIISACTQNDIAPPVISAQGLLVKEQITTYQYGTHLLVLPGDPTKYALRSSTINLTKFENQSVSLAGYQIRGYPVDGGPVYLDVIWIKRL